MRRGLLIYGFLMLWVTFAGAQGSWNPPGARTGYPRILLDSASVPLVRETLALSEILGLYTSVWQNVNSTFPAGNTTDGDRITRAMLAKEAAFVVLMNRKTDGNTIVSLPADERDSLILKSRLLLEQINTNVGYQEGWVFYQEWQHRSKELIGYLTAFDLLRGAGVTGDELRVAQDSLIRFTANLYHRAMATYQVFFFPLKFFEFQFDNHSIMTASALGLAATVFNDHSSADPDNQPLNWINAGMWNLDNTMWVENGLYPRVAEPDTLSGYAEGPGYFDYAFQNAFPFIRAMGNFLPDDTLSFTFGNITRQIRNPWFDARYHRIYDWMNRIRMPDGSLPAIHDSPIGFGTTITALSGNPEFNLSNPVFTPDNPMIRTQYIATQVAHGEITDSLFQPLPEAGSLVFRSGWDTAAIYWHFIGKHGIPLSGAKSHHQGDATSFSLFAHGELLAVDPGYPGSTESDAVNKPTDHNLILVNGNGPNPPNGEFVSTTTNTAYIENYFDLPGLDYGEIRSTYQGAAVTRKALFIRNTYGLLGDFITSSGLNTYTFQLHGNGLFGATASSPTGKFNPDFSSFSGTWQRDSVRLSATSLCGSGNTKYTFETDSMATGASTYRHYSKMLTSSGAGISNTFFLTSLLPSIGTNPVLPHALILPGCRGLRISSGGHIDFIFCQQENSLTEATPVATGFTESVFGNGNLNLLMADNTGKPTTWFLQNGDSLVYGAQPYILASHLMDIAFEQTGPVSFAGFVSDSGMVKIHSELPLRVESGNISSISYDAGNRLNSLAFTAKGNFRLQVSNGCYEPLSNQLPFSIFPNPSHDGRFTLTIVRSQAMAARLQVTDAAGKCIFQTETCLKKGINDLPVNLTGSAPGIYSVSLISGSVSGHAVLIRR